MGGSRKRSLKRQVQAGEPRSVIGQTVEKIEEMLGATGANLTYAGYPYDPFASDAPRSWNGRLTAGAAPRLAQDEKPEYAGGETRSGGGLGEMTRRKREITGLANERDFPHLVELALPPGPFRSVILEIDAFHRERRIPVRRGRSRHEAEQSYIRFCFPDTATADAFRNRFGGECLTHAPAKPKPRT